MTTIRYFIPEDGDEESQPNVFLAPKSRQPGAPPTLQAVRDAFPLVGHYHFRFKSPLFPGADREKGAMAVWMDVTNDGQTVPLWNNGIIAKVTRLSMEEDDDDEDDEDFRSHATGASAQGSAPPVHTNTPAPAPPPRAPLSHASSNGSGDHLDMLFDTTTTTNTAGISPAASAEANLFDAHPHHPSAPSTGGSLLDFGASPPPTAAAHNDFLGMSAPSHQSHHPPHPQGQYPAPAQQQQQQQQQQQRPPQQGGQKTFQSYGQQAQPFGDLGGW